MRPTLHNFSAFAKKENEPLYYCDLRGLSTPEVYLAMLLPAMPVSSYLTFSPSLRQAGAVYSLWHVLLLYGCPPNTLIYHKADCSALPGLSSPVYTGAIERLALCKDKKGLGKAG